ncbi:YfhO family protein [Sediminibacillus albus]|uniref:Uncharacterized membrane protein YfhO n=1 Tax=Sediminibacillus albus TaxID=407036 RepID=A0A1G8WFA5_9BACI|nr:YfhO family protein [Sediminibacillus albus]SDJ76846.1 Uncharacterized membrane protein YfhO [Sediminibacillus albus]
MKNNQSMWKLILISFLFAVLAHGFFLYQWWQGVYMAGPNDGLSQMLPFRSMLYDQLTKGNLFYSYIYGLGGSTFTQLAYYYGINVYFFMNVLVVYVLELLAIIPKPDVLFWAQAAIFISIVRLTLILVITTLTFRYMKLTSYYAFIGAVLYGSSVMYFRHVTYWEFFGDAFLWLPLLVLGTEKIMREQRPGWFIAAVAIALIDNFYFAFISFCFIAIYIVLRWFLPLVETEAAKVTQLKIFAAAGLLGFGIGSIGFIPSVWGLFHNHRPAYDQYVPLLDATSNILYNSRLFIIPAIFVLLLFVFSFYKDRLFRLFALLAVLFSILHFVPLAASFFNGMSAPQHRFEYLGFFAIGGTVAAGLQQFRKTDIRELLPAAVLTFYCYAAFYLLDPKVDFHKPLPLLMIAGAGVIIFAALASVTISRKTGFTCLVLGVLVSHLLLVNQFQHDKLFLAGDVNTTTKEYILSENYYSQEQRSLINEVLEEDDSTLARLEWKTDGRNNTPIIQEFPGLSVYSSILNEELLFFYYHDLEIDMKRESVSRYSGFGDRANLHSILGGKYIMYEKQKEKNIPYGFERFMDNENYVVYRNNNSLPFVRTASLVYSEEYLEGKTVLGREHAMLQGIILKEPSEQSAGIHPVKNLLDEAEIKPVNASYQANQLEVTGKSGGLDIKPRNPQAPVKDYYLSFYLKNNDKHAPLFPLHVNDFRTSRKSRESIYRTNVNQITIRVPENEVISLRVPEGSYTLKNIDLYAEDYQLLEQAASKDQPQADTDINGNKISIHLNNMKNDHYLTIPVPYEKGWRVYVNGERRSVEKANYAFLGTSIEPGKNDITFVYYPPYIRTTAIIALLSAALAFVWLFRRKIKK